MCNHDIPLKSVKGQCGHYILYCPICGVPKGQNKCLKCQNKEKK
jgi:hypothetical protein